MNMGTVQMITDKVNQLWE